MPSLTFVKSLLEPLRPVWEFIKSLFNVKPMKFIRAISKLSRMITKVLQFLSKIITVFTNNFPISLFELVEPIASQLLQPLLRTSPGLQDIGIARFFQEFIQSVTEFISGNSPMLYIRNLTRTVPAFGLLVWFFIIIKDSIVGSVNYLFGPILSIIGIDLSMNNGFAQPVQTQISDSQLSDNEFDSQEINMMRFNNRWETHNAWTSNLGIYTREDREDILDLQGLDLAPIITDLELYTHESNSS